MVVKHSDQRVGIFVDVQNMYHSAKKLYGARVNFKNILKDAVAERRLVIAIAYVVQSKTVEEENFFEALAGQGYKVKMKDLQVFAGGAKKADWDVGMAVDAIRLSSRLDAVVIVTGDGDFVPLVEYLQSHGLQVEAMAFRESASQRLVESADDFINLSDNTRRFLLRK